MKEEYIAAEVTEVRRPFYRHVSWSAIAAGLAVAMVVQIVLTMLGVSIGAATIQPLEENNPVEGLGIGAGIWWFITGLISLFVGAFVAGRLAGVFRKKDGALHGFLMWSTATVVAFSIAGVAGGFFGTGAMSAMSEPENRNQAMSGLEKTADKMGLGDYENDYNDNNYSQNRTGTSPATPYSGMNPNTTTNDDQFDTANRDTRGTGRADDSRMGSGNVDPENRYPTTYDTSSAGTVGGTDNRTGGNVNLMDEDDKVGAATTDDNDRVAVGSQEEAQAREAGDKAASAAAKAALLALVSLLIGAGVCTWAGARGVPHDYIPPREHDTRVPTGALPTNP